MVDSTRINPFITQAVANFYSPNAQPIRNKENQPTRAEGSNALFPGVITGQPTQAVTPVSPTFKGMTQMPVFNMEENTGQHSRGLAVAKNLTGLFNGYLHGKKNICSQIGIG